MNTTISTKGTAHGFGRIASLLAVAALIIVVGILTVALYVRAPQTASTAAASNSTAANAAPDQHDRHADVFALSLAVYAPLEQRRGEWLAHIANAQDPFLEQRHGEWASGS